jgi:hypothetical protein
MPVRILAPSPRSFANSEMEIQPGDNSMSYIHHDRNDEQMLFPITLIRGGPAAMALS